MLQLGQQKHVSNHLLQWGSSCLPALLLYGGCGPGRGLCGAPQNSFFVRPWLWTMDLCRLISLAVLWIRVLQTTRVIPRPVRMRPRREFKDLWPAHARRGIQPLRVHLD